MPGIAEQIPKKHGQMFFRPSFSQWKEDALRNRERLVKQIVWGQSAAKVRAALKMPVDQPIVLTGHQPVFYHPGLWAKCLAASTLAESLSGTAFHKVTDTALAVEHPHFVPEVEDNGKSRHKQIEFFTNKDLQQQEKTVPYAFLPAPDFAALENIFNEAQIFCPAAVRKNIQGYQERILKGLKKNASWNDFHLSMLKILDETCGTQRTTFLASKMWASEPFVQFVASWLTNLPEMNEAYNLALDEYRKKYGITHDLTPMPNLKFEDWWFEIPFWGVTGNHQRHSLWAKKDGKHMVLKVKGGSAIYSLDYDELHKQLGTIAIGLWPKAIPQTLFCRLYLCDYFIHGLGGAAYEEVGDTIFSNVFKLKPLSFGAVTATYLVDPQASRGVEMVSGYGERIEWWERSLAQNPEYLFTRAEAWSKELPAFMHPAFKNGFNNPSLRKLAEEKGRLVALLKDPAKRAGASARIKQVNFSLYDGYTDILKVLEQGLMDVNKVKDTREVLGNREYPFFCYPPEIFVEMKEKIRQAANPAS